MHAVELNKVCCGYGVREVLHNVSLTLPEHALAGIVGPNGGGKTTLLKLLLGTIRPTYGTVRVLGRTPEEARRRIGYVPQHFEFDERYPIRVRDVVRAGRLDRHGFGPYRREDREAAATALERVGLQGLERRPFADLSGGERQRLLVAQALAGDPDLLLLDEPTASVDAVVARELHALFARLTRELTVVMVSHNLSVVAAQATHVICVNRTAEMHDATAMGNHRFRTAAGLEMLLVRHDSHCHVIDASEALNSPHAGSRVPVARSAPE